MGKSWLKVFFKDFQNFLKYFFTEKNNICEDEGMDSISDAQECELAARSMASTEDMSMAGLPGGL